MPTPPEFEYIFRYTESPLSQRCGCHEGGRRHCSGPARWIHPALRGARCDHHREYLARTYEATRDDRWIVFEPGSESWGEVERWLAQRPPGSWLHPSVQLPQKAATTPTPAKTWVATCKKCLEPGIWQHPTLGLRCDRHKNSAIKSYPPARPAEARFRAGGSVGQACDARVAAEEAARSRRDPVEWGLKASSVPPPSAPPAGDELPHDYRCHHGASTRVRCLQDSQYEFSSGVIEYLRQVRFCESHRPVLETSMLSLLDSLGLARMEKVK